MIAVVCTGFEAVPPDRFDEIFGHHIVPSGQFSIADFVREGSAQTLAVGETDPTLTFDVDLDAGEVVIDAGASTARIVNADGLACESFVNEVSYVLVPGGTLTALEPVP